MSEASSVTFAQDTLHNPAEPRHFMKIKAAGRPIEIWAGGQRIAASTAAVRLLEVGRDLYDPVLYLPREDVTAELVPFERTTHCPLKGDASYFARPGDEEPIAWSYEAPLSWAEVLRGRVAFDADRVEIREGTGR